LPVFWQQIIDLLVGHAGEAVEHVFEIRKGFVAVASGAFDQGVEDVLDGCGKEGFLDDGKVLGEPWATWFES